MRHHDGRKNKRVLVSLVTPPRSPPIKTVAQTLMYGSIRADDGGGSGRVCRSAARALSSTAEDWRVGGGYGVRAKRQEERGIPARHGKYACVHRYYSRRVDVQS